MLVYDPVGWFYHKEPNTTAEYLNIQTKSGITLSLSPAHLLIIGENCNSGILPESFYEINKDFSLFAHRVKVGDCIPSLNKGKSKISWDPVVKIWREFKTGAHSPMTATGTVVVNDVHVSCFSHFESHGIHQLIYRLLKAQWNLWNKIRSYISGEKLSLKLKRQGVPKLLQLLVPLAELASEYHFY